MGEKESRLNDFEGELWGAIEAEHGPIGELFRQSCREDLIRDLEEAGYYDGDPYGWAESLAVKKTAIEEILEKVRAWMDDKFPELAKQEAKGPATTKTYKKSLERRIHILDFCFELVGEGIRPNWAKITAEWNKKHPFDKMTLGTLKAAFSKAKKDKQAMYNWALSQIGPLEIEWNPRIQKSESMTIPVPQTIEEAQTMSKALEKKLDKGGDAN